MIKANSGVKELFALDLFTPHHFTADDKLSLIAHVHIPDRRLQGGSETVGATLSMSVGGRVKAEGAVEPGGAQADEAAQIPGAQLFSQGEAATETDGQIPLRHGEVERPVDLSPRRRREAHPHEAHEEAEPFHDADES